MESIRATKQILPFLGDSNTRMRIAAVRSLGKIADPRTVNPLIALAKNRQESQTFRITVITALQRKTANPDVLAALADINTDQSENAEIRAAARRCDMSRETAQEAHERILNMFLEMLRHDNMKHRIEAAKALGQLRDPRAVEPLIEILPTLSYPGLNVQESELADSVIGALGEIGDARAVLPLAKHIDTNLERSQEDRDREFHKLLDMVRHDNTQDRLAAALALGRLKDTRAVGPLIEILPTLSFDNADVENCQLAHRVVWALGELRDDRAVFPLIDLIKTTRSSSHDAIDALKKIGDQSHKHGADFAKDHSDAAVRRCFHVLCNLGQTTKAPLLEFLNNEDITIRQNAVGALCFRRRFHGDPEVDEHLTRCLRNGGVYQMEASYTLAIMEHLGDQRIDEYLPSFFKKTNGEFLSNRKDPSTTFQQSPLNAIICRPLIALLNHEDERVRKGAVDVLRSQVVVKSADSMIRKSDVIAVVRIKERTKYSGDHTWHAELLQTIKGKPNQDIVIWVPGQTLDVQEGRYLAFLETINDVYAPFGRPYWKYGLLRIEDQNVLWPDYAGGYKWTRTEVNAVIADISKTLSTQNSQPQSTVFPVVNSWARTEDGEITANPVATDGSFRVKVIDKRFEARNLDGTVVWTYDGRTYVPSSTGPVYKNHVIVPSKKDILSRDLETGEVQWKFSPHELDQRPKDSDEVSSEQNRSNAAGELPRKKKESDTTASKDTKGAWHWWSFASPAALDGDCIYVADDHTYVYRGSFCATGAVGPSHLFCLDAASGKELWRVEIPTGVSQCPVSYDAENIYIVREYGVTCVSKKERRLLWSKDDATVTEASAFPNGEGMIVAGYALKCLSIKDGAVLWEVEGGMHGDGGKLVDGVLYTKTQSFLSAISADTGDILWQAGFPLGITGQVTCDGQSVYLKCEDRSLYCLDRKNGDIRWQYPMSAEKDGPSTPILTSEGVLLPFKNKTVFISHEGNDSLRGQ